MPDTPDIEAEKSADPINVASIVASQVTIETVVLSESRTKRTPDFGVDQHRFEFASTIERINFGIEREKKKVFIVPSFSIRRQIEGKLDPDDSLIIDATFVLIYSLVSVEGIEDRHIDAFAATSGIYNAWPYWREFVQNTSVRMGMTAIVIPPFRLNH
jgi:hypothetical protein